MQFRTAAALANGTLVFALYLIAWGGPSATILAIEVVLAICASWSTWFALKRVKLQNFARMSMLGKRQTSPAQA